MSTANSDSKSPMKELAGKAWNMLSWLFFTILLPAVQYIFNNLVRLADHYLKPRTFPNSMLRQRTGAIDELVETEVKYRQHMSDMQKYQDELTPLITPDETRLVFGNVQPLILLSEQFSQKFEAERERGYKEAEIHKCFEGSAHCLALFTPYSQRYPEASEFVCEKMKNKAFRAACEKVEAEAGVHPLTSLLVMPIQRMTKYPLLIKEVLKATPSWHPDSEKLQETLKEIQAAAQKVDRKVDEAGRREAMVKLQDTVKNCPNLIGEAHRVLLGTWKSENGEHEYVLLTDMLLVISVQKSGKECKKSVMLQGIKTVEKIENGLKLIDDGGNKVKIAGVADSDDMCEQISRQVQAESKKNQ